MLKFLATIWLEGVRNFWSNLRWCRHRKDESEAIPEVNADNLNSVLREVYNNFEWTMDDWTQLFDSMRPAPYVYNLYFDAENAKGRFKDDCFTGDVKIKCLDGNSYSLKELVDNNIQELWVYSCEEDGTIVPAKAILPRAKQTNTPLIKITLDNGEVIKCTEDHLFMLRDGTYKKAKNLVPNEDSLMPGYTRINKEGYMEIKDNKTQKFTLVHQMVNNYCNPQGKQEAIERLQSQKYKNDVLVTHHIDHNKTNNLPENLEWKTWREHADKHLIEYNQSEAHKKKAAEMGPINGTKRLIQYNQSAEHKDTVAAMNRDSSIKILQMRGRILSVASRAKSKFGVVNESTYNFCRIPACPKYNKILNYFDSPEEFQQCADTYNHKVVSIENIGNETVYDITVPETNNFLLDSGVFVHNCDGYHTVIYHILKNNGYDVALITVATKPIQRSHTMCAIKEKIEENGVEKTVYRVIDYTAIRGPYTSLQDFVDDYRYPVRYWALDQWDYNKKKFRGVSKKEF